MSIFYKNMKDQYVHLHKIANNEIKAIQIYKGIIICQTVSCVYRFRNNMSNLLNKPQICWVQNVCCGAVVKKIKVPKIL